MEKVFIPVLLGTGRIDRLSEHAAKFVVSEVGKNEKIETKLIDVKEYGYTVTVPPWGTGGADETPTPWKEIMARADGLIIVTPEYNHGYPGELKMLLDSLYDEYEKKPVLLCGVSGGGLGGARMVEHIKPVLIELKMVPMRSALYFSNVKKLFNTEGTMQEKSQEEVYEKQVSDALTELLWYAETLKKGRT